MTAAGNRTYEIIERRCAALFPPVDLAKHIKPGTLQVQPRTLDGIAFVPNDPELLSNEFSGRMLYPNAANMPKPAPGPFAVDTRYMPRPANASMISMREDPGHWALKASLGATIGEGFREVWQPPPKSLLPLLPPTRFGSDRLSLGFGTAGTHLKFTALHAAVSPNVCSIHIDERGFMMNLPEGTSLTASFWSHLADELLVQTLFCNWLDGKIGDSAIGSVLVEVVNRLSVRFPDAANGFAGLEDKVNRITGVTDLRGIGNTLKPIGVSIDVARFENSTVQANYYNYDGQKTYTLTWGGTFGNSGPK